MQWKEIPRDWIWDGNPNFINSEIRSQIGRRQLKQEEVAAIIGIKRQAMARRLRDAADPNRTPWRRSELKKLAGAWGISLYELTGYDESVEDSASVRDSP